GGDGLPHLGLAPVGDLGEDLLGGRVDVVERGAGGGLDELAVDEHPVLGVDRGRGRVAHASFPSAGGRGASVTVCMPMLLPVRSTPSTALTRSSTSTKQPASSPLASHTGWNSPSRSKSQSDAIGNSVAASPSPPAH